MRFRVFSGAGRGWICDFERLVVPGGDFGDIGDARAVILGDIGDIRVAVEHSIADSGLSDPNC